MSYKVFNSFKSFLSLVRQCLSNKKMCDPTLIKTTKPRFETNLKSVSVTVLL